MSELTRREVLKLGGLAASAFLASACGVPVGRSEGERENLRYPEGGYVEVGNGKSIVLTDTHGKEGVFSVTYAGDVIPMQMRGDSYQVDQDLNAFRYNPKEFSPGQEVRRYTGERCMS